MTQNLYIEELQNVLKHVVSETTSIAEELAIKASQIMTKNTFKIEKGIKLSNTERIALQHEIKTALQHSAYCQGMGFASYSPKTQEEQDYWTLEWWYKKDDQLQQAKLENYQNAQRFLDFRSFEWFQQPAQSKQPYIHGPYVDYICNGAYTITIAHPVIVEYQFIGVIAIDIFVSALEKILMPNLKNIKQTMVITNDNARVITSNHVTIRTGTLLKNMPAASSITRPCPSFQMVFL
ncbi:histidine kinase [Acinetobacter sp. ANC 4558]|uniref:cache domain-containing protein n=1 Tax=Acinetobacter sp. ANC 4558 TaxID=1977876 RepID=UPI000A348C46|nr:cache domain-containing protein [Acinetobacter sp. ANC 4558]OTG85459.1 histidine kinase [Acinetobacter sp. ANC 4558]